MVKKLHRHLNIMRLSSDDDEPLILCSPRSAVHTRRRCPRLHYFYLTSAHVPDFVDFATSFPNDATNKVVRNVDLLSL